MYLATTTPCNYFPIESSHFYQSPVRQFVALQPLPFSYIQPALHSLKSFTTLSLKHQSWYFLSMRILLGCSLFLCLYLTIYFYHFFLCLSPSQHPFILYLYFSLRQSLYLCPSSSVQHECIPQALLGMDIICQAKSGKLILIISSLCTVFSFTFISFIICFILGIINFHIIIIIAYVHIFSSFFLGMGKTAVFVLATLHQLTPVAGECHVVVLCHTRCANYQNLKFWKIAKRKRWCAYMSHQSTERGRQEK